MARHEGCLDISVPERNGLFGRQVPQLNGRVHVYVHRWERGCFVMNGSRAGTPTQTMLEKCETHIVSPAASLQYVCVCPVRNVPTPQERDVCWR